MPRAPKYSFTSQIVWALISEALPKRIRKSWTLTKNSFARASGKQAEQRGMAVGLGTCAPEAQKWSGNFILQERFRLDSTSKYGGDYHEETSVVVLISLHLSGVSNPHLPQLKYSKVSNVQDFLYLNSVNRFLYLNTLYSYAHAPPLSEDLWML